MPPKASRKTRSSDAEAEASVRRRAARSDEADIDSPATEISSGTTSLQSPSSRTVPTVPRRTAAQVLGALPVLIECLSTHDACLFAEPSALYYIVRSVLTVIIFFLLFSLYQRYFFTPFFRPSPSIDTRTLFLVGLAFACV